MCLLYSVTLCIFSTIIIRMLQDMNPTKPYSWYCQDFVPPKSIWHWYDIMPVGALFQIANFQLKAIGFGHTRHSQAWSRSMSALTCDAWDQTGNGTTIGMRNWIDSWIQMVHPGNQSVWTWWKINGLLSLPTLQLTKTVEPFRIISHRRLKITAVSESWQSFWPDLGLSMEPSNAVLNTQICPLYNIYIY